MKYRNKNRQPITVDAANGMGNFFLISYLESIFLF